MMPLRCAMLAILCAAAPVQVCARDKAEGQPAGATSDVASASFREWAPTPPMGWNSFNAYETHITESQLRAIVDVLSQRALPAGYDHVVLDAGWFNPGPESADYDNAWRIHAPYQTRDPVTGLLIPRFVHDECGRPQPALNRFPSAAGGRGLKPLADYVHSKGMKFGLHIMRGVMTQIVEDNLPVCGTNLRFRDIVVESDRSMFVRGQFTGLNHRHEQAQIFYDRLIQQYADWGVDFIKADDMLRHKYHAREIEMIRRAIDKTKRPIVLSLSLGEAPVSQAHHLQGNANMWRVSPDVWDRWEDIFRAFDLAYRWSPFTGNGTWPDADMIPIGRLRITGWNFAKKPNMSVEQLRWWSEHEEDFLSPVERRTLMTLWAITRSPLMWGGDPLTAEAEIWALLTNPRIIAMNQQGLRPRQVLGNGNDEQNLRVWVSDAADGKSRYVALFNRGEAAADVTFPLYFEDMIGNWQATDLWSGKDAGVVSGKLVRTLEPHDSAVFLLSPLDH